MMRVWKRWVPEYLYLQIVMDVAPKNGQTHPVLHLKGNKMYRLPITDDLSLSFLEMIAQNFQRRKQQGSF